MIAQIKVILGPVTKQKNELFAQTLNFTKLLKFLNILKNFLPNLDSKLISRDRVIFDITRQFLSREGDILF
jgi:hypothetical protein